MMFLRYLLAYLSCALPVCSLMLFYADKEHVRVRKNITSVLQWHFNSSGKVADGICHDIKCYVVKSQRMYDIGNWSLTSVAINKAINRFYDGRLSLACSSMLVTLTISDSTYEDSGRYFCMYKNKTADVTLTVTGGPTFSSKNFSSSLLLEENSPSTFEVVYCGNPAPSVTWEFLKTRFTSTAEQLEAQNGTVQSWRRSFCYHYRFTISKVIENVCKPILRYTVTGFRDKSTHESIVTVKYLPKKLKNVHTRLENGCYVTKWNGPITGPRSCQTSILYDVLVKLTSSEQLSFSTYSTTFVFCNDTVDTALVGEINVRYRNQYGNGSYVSSSIGKERNSTIVVVSGGDTSGNGDDYSSVVYALSALLCLILLVGMLATGFYCFRRNFHSEKHEKQDEPSRPIVVETPTRVPRMDTKKFNTITKNSIVPKPRPMSHVVTKPVTKSNTFHGSTYANRYTDEPTLQKAYMPLNTLQRRISESLQAYGQMYSPGSRNSLPMSKAFVIENNNIEFNRLSGAGTDSTACTPEEIRKYEEKRNLSRMNSLESMQSEYDTPRNNTSMKKAHSNYDLPRCHTYQPDRTGLNNRAQSMYDLPYAVSISLAASRDKQDLREYDLPRSREVMYANNRKVSDDTRKISETSDYSTPRNTIYEEDDEFPTELYSSNKSEYDRPRVSLQERELNCETTFTQSVSDLYDTPRLHHKNKLLLKKSHSLDVREPSVHATYDDSQRRATVAAPENIYDNIRNYLEEKKSDCPVIYEQIPMRLRQCMEDSET